MRIGVVGDSDVAVGFRLAGLTDVYEVKSPEQASKAIEELDNNAEIGLIITTERIGEGIRETIANAKKVIVEVPDKNGPIVREKDPVKILVRNAVGIDIK
ncbi:Vacuolar H+transporting two-sector ATPase F subunit [Methanococcus vannielii SB]|jgi:V/A-type H+-transporting ATPase subunit F|uniref:A-type ATP synthase subunit F n=1 Tax=Methanococcus vannielii (strain ATCC 35089 / DSM 1224 / JCM 13029 / OCM 148 / SB) TaxID=406327 RepID=AATF_METVS|nr:V-type ATP synthase subunit F [Methanococcus vannielii]A6UP53.1 RecName: Full=V-type ATP synthase subunit F; AltName: Full=V-ATPase subunit F [Methanococcus vannielii SB]ABR54275.1 Vacuolar H+transporting two-sector ATPase F subunit [Methanococcus vannielii SB]